jgi:endonuclease/exonuclease/phosphatase family metal-dependent hydrolase
MRLRVVTFNVFHDYPLLRHVEARFALLEAGLALEAPDVVLLQEISVSEAHGHLPNRLVAALRSRGLEYEMVYAAANGSVGDGGSFEEGGAILARHPIAASAVHRLAADRPVVRELHGYRFVEHRVAIRGTILVPDGGLLDVFGVHLTDASPTDGRVPRREQVEDFERFVAERPAAGRPTIVAGDFNAAPDADEIGWLASRGFRDLCAAEGAQATNDRHDRDLETRRDTSDQRIDYVFALAPADAEVRVVDARLFLAAAASTDEGGWLWASDHNGVLVDLEIN